MWWFKWSQKFAIFQKLQIIATFWKTTNNNRKISWIRCLQALGVGGPYMDIWMGSSQTLVLKNPKIAELCFLFAHGGAFYWLIINEDDQPVISKEKVWVCMCTSLDIPLLIFLCLSLSVIKKEAYMFKNTGLGVTKSWKLCWRNITITCSIFSKFSHNCHACQNQFAEAFMLWWLVFHIISSSWMSSIKWYSIESIVTYIKRFKSC